MIDMSERILIDEKICNGRPIIRGKRITIQTILEFLSAGESGENNLQQYLSLEEDDIHACLHFAAKCFDSRFTIREALHSSNIL